jgi:AcrR family transcriptional regulator
MSALTRRRQHTAELRGMILDAARDLFVREGYQNVSMRKLAEKIEYSPASIYLHFRGKEALLGCLVEESFDRLYHTLEQVRHDDPVEMLRAALRAYVGFGLKHPNHYHFAFVIRSGQAGAGPYRPHQAFEFLRGCVRRCISAGRFRRVDAEAAAQILWAAVHGITSLLIARPSFPWVRRELLIGEMIDNSIRGLLAER